MSERFPHFFDLFLSYVIDVIRHGTQVTQHLHNLELHAILLHAIRRRTQVSQSLHNLGRCSLPLIGTNFCPMASYEAVEIADISAAPEWCSEDIRTRET